jgi:hypothetical protein
MLGWPTQSENRRDYVRLLRDLSQRDKSIFLVHWDAERKLGARRRIHIWWGGLQGNGGLMLLLAFLLQADRHWKGAEVTLLTVVEDEETARNTIRVKDQIIEDARIQANTRVILRQGRPIHVIMREESADADLAILGIGLPEEADAEGFFERMEIMLREMPTTILVKSSRTFVGEPVLFASDPE